MTTSVQPRMSQPCAAVKSSAIPMCAKAEERRTPPQMNRQPKETCHDKSCSHESQSKPVKKENKKQQDPERGCHEIPTRNPPPYKFPMRVTLSARPAFPSPKRNPLKKVNDRQMQPKGCPENDVKNKK
ncbi:hypothetical protein AOQ84DRAFT_199137 [Glonium stellatum]|uniref:Uncharacterized protein n=1 Tax=Glonium stellatum TaxID=574774 RepID=A0A8E2F6D1_9PEZI|nr:hypothetical protein AOQ84DRAFT_199137 [Glonium stellatum]